MNRAATERPIHHSIDASALAYLTDEQQELLTQVLDRYLSALEKGTPLEHESLLAEHPGLSDILRAYFHCLEQLHGAAAGFGSVSHRECRHRHEATDDAKRIGDFVLMHEIGRGGMGVVYEAQQISLDRRVAVKLLPFAAILDARQIARFKNEAQAAAQVQHPNIVPVYAIGVERGVHYYAMQFIDGQPLDRAIAELKARTSRVPRPEIEFAPAPPGTAEPAQSSARRHASDGRETRNDCHAPTEGSRLAHASANRAEYFGTIARLGIQAAEALHAAHEYGVVHRDVKPSNLLFDANGKLWVTDFGLARCRKAVSHTLTRTGDVVGTLRYMSPEQATGQSTLVDHRTDIYSLGVTLYELLCLRPAYPDENPALLARKIDQHEPPRPRQVQPDVPADLEAVVLKAMSKHREERYSTAQQLADDLRRVLDGKPTLARPPSTLDRLAKWSRRHRRMVATAVAALAFAVVALGAATLLIAHEKARAERNFVRAERYLRDSRDMLDHFGLKLSERLADVPGASTVRQELLRETLEYYRDFMDDAKDDPSLRAEMGLTYSRIARLNEELGSGEESIPAHEQSLRLFEELARANPANLEYEKQYALCKNNLALSLSRAGRIEEASRQFADAIRIQQRLVSKSPGDEKLVADLALSFSNQGLLQGETGQSVSAQAAFRSAIDLLQLLVDAQPNDAERRHKLAAANNNLAATRLDDNPAEAVALHRQALQHQLAAAEARPDDMTYRRNVALTLNNLGAAHSRIGQPGDALWCHEKAVAIQEELVRLAPAQRFYQSDLAVSHSNMGLIHQRGGRVADAERFFRQALAIQQRLVEQFPDDIASESTLGGIFNNLGIVFEETGRLDSAAHAFVAAIEHQRRAYSRAADVTRFRSFLSKHYYNYGRVLRQLGRIDEAVRSALARRELWTHDPQRLFTVAEELALVCGQAKRDPAAKASPEECSRLTVETLRQAIAAGLVLPADMENREPFVSLRESPDFARLMGR